MNDNTINIIIIHIAFTAANLLAAFTICCYCISVRLSIAIVTAAVGPPAGPGGHGLWEGGMYIMLLTLAFSYSILYMTTADSIIQWLILRLFDQTTHFETTCRLSNNKKRLWQAWD